MSVCCWEPGSTGLLYAKHTRSGTRSRRQRVNTAERLCALLYMPRRIRHECTSYRCERSECVDSWLTPATAPSRALRARTLVVLGWITGQGVQAPKTMHPRQAAWCWDCASTDTGRASDSSDRSKTQSHQAPQCTHPNGRVQECARRLRSDYQSCVGMLQ